LCGRSLAGFWLVSELKEALFQWDPVEPAMMLQVNRPSSLGCSNQSQLEERPAASSRVVLRSERWCGDQPCRPCYLVSGTDRREPKVHVLRLVTPSRCQGAQHPPLIINHRRNGLGCLLTVTAPFQPSSQSLPDERCPRDAVVAFWSRVEMHAERDREIERSKRAAAMADWDASLVQFSFSCFLSPNSAGHSPTPQSETLHRSAASDRQTSLITLPSKRVHHLLV